jgi:hypothetical protein
MFQNNVIIVEGWVRAVIGRPTNNILTKWEILSKFTLAVTKLNVYKQWNVKISVTAVVQNILNVYTFADYILLAREQNKKSMKLPFKNIIKMYFY